MGTPVLIPHTEVKHRSADGTRKGRVGSRQHKVFNTISNTHHSMGVFCLEIVYYSSRLNM